MKDHGRDCARAARGIGEHCQHYADFCADADVEYQCDTKQQVNHMCTNYGSSFLKPSTMPRQLLKLNARRDSPYPTRVASPEGGARASPHARADEIPLQPRAASGRALCGEADVNIRDAHEKGGKEGGEAPSGRGARSAGCTGGRGGGGGRRLLAGSGVASRPRLRAT